jgi:DNA polymerase III subunit delta
MSEHIRIIQQIKSKVIHPVYLLFGEEPYYIDMIAKAVEDHVLDPSEKEFNQQIFYGYDSDVPKILEAARRYPMVANQQVVIVREAQMLKNIEAFQSFAENPVKSTVLVLCYKYKKIDKRKGLYKACAKNGVAFESVKLRDFQLSGWIANIVKERGYRIAERESVMIAENLGNDLGKIGNELEKVFISLPSGSLITADIIERNIGISKDFNMFELQSAIARNDIAKATRIALYMGDNQKENPLVVIIAVLYSFFSRLMKLHFASPSLKQQDVAVLIGVNPFFVKEYQEAARHYDPRKTVQVIEMLRSADLKSKGLDSGSVSNSDLLKELVFKILH